MLIKTFCLEIIHCDALLGYIPFVQFKKREKHPWMSVTFSLKVTLLQGCFSRFLNCTNDTKSRKTSHMIIENENGAENEKQITKVRRK